MYSRKLLDHFEHPRNPGVLEHPDAVVQVENPVCGDVLKLTATLLQGKINEIRFQAMGCVPSIACASALTELVKDKTLAEAGTVRGEDVIQAVGGVPVASNHAGQLAVAALKQLLSSLNGSGSK